MAKHHGKRGFGGSTHNLKAGQQTGRKMSGDESRRDFHNSVKSTHALNTPEGRKGGVHGIPDLPMRGGFRL